MLPYKLEHYDEDTGNWYVVELWDGKNDKIEGPIIAELSFIHAPGQGVNVLETIVQKLEKINKWVRLEIEPTTPSAHIFLQKLCEKENYSILYGSSLVYEGSYVYWLEINEPNNS